MDLLSKLEQGMNAAGGSLAVAFIITLAAGILAMTLVYAGSALLVLDRFARVAKGWLRIGLAGFAVAVCLAILATLESIPSDSVFTWNEWRDAFGQHDGVWLLIVDPHHRRVRRDVAAHADQGLDHRETLDLVVVLPRLRFLGAEVQASDQLLQQGRQIFAVQINASFGRLAMARGRPACRKRHLRTAVVEKI